MPEWWDCSDGIVGIKRKRKTHNWNKIFMNCNENTHEKAVARMTRARWQKCFFSFVVVAAAVWRHHFFSANAYQIKSPNYFRTQCVIATVSIRFLLFFFLVGYHSFGMFEHCHVLRNDKHKKKLILSYVIWSLGQCPIHTSTWWQSCKMLKSMNDNRAGYSTIHIDANRMEIGIEIEKNKIRKKKKKHATLHRICMTSLTHGIINTEVLFHVLDSVCFPYGQQHMNKKKTEQK